MWNFKSLSFLLNFNQTGNVAISSVHVVYSGSEDLGDNSIYGQGTYNLIGKDKNDDSAIYAQSQKDHDKKHLSGWSFILRSGYNKEWIGTVMIFILTCANDKMILANTNLY